MAFKNRNFYESIGLPEYKYHYFYDEKGFIFFYNYSYELTNFMWTLFSKPLGFSGKY